MKKVLIVSPHFPPVNAADMHRVRQSLPYFKQFGWEPTVLCVAPEYVEMAMDDNLEKSIPKDIEIQKVMAYSTKYTRKFGLGNLGIRAFWQLYKEGHRLLKAEQFDLVYFSTTVFASMPLGRLWKRKFKIPFIIDMQDPWRNDYYLTLSKAERPPKFWFAHRLNCFLEKKTIPWVDGIISVSTSYINILKKRYPLIKNVPVKVITFGTHSPDLIISKNLKKNELKYNLDNTEINIVYAGAVPPNMLFVIEAILTALKKGHETNPDFKIVKLHFIGTNYAIGNKRKSLLKGLIDKFGLNNNVFEKQDRVSYFEVLKLIQESDLAIIPGTTDKDYTASKIYPYISAKVPLLSVFHEESSVNVILKEIEYGRRISFNNQTNPEVLSDKIYEEICRFLQLGQPNSNFKEKKFSEYESESKTAQQTSFFEETLLSKK